MLDLVYKIPNLESVIHIEEDDTLTLAFAKFVRMCEIIGYQDGSWERILNTLAEDGFEEMSVGAREQMGLGEDC